MNFSLDTSEASFDQNNAISRQHEYGAHVLRVLLVLALEDVDSERAYDRLFRLSDVL